MEDTYAVPSYSYANLSSQSPPTTVQTPQASFCSLRERPYEQQSARENLPSRTTSPSNGDDEQNEFEDIILYPLPSALTYTSTHYDPAARSPLDEIATGRFINPQRSLTDTLFDKCSPLVQRTTSALQQQTSKVSLHSSRKSIANFISTVGKNINTDSPSNPVKTRSPKAISEWFSGSSAPINIGLVPAQHRNIDPTDDEGDDEDEEEEGDEEMFTQSKSQKQRQAKGHQTSPASKFSWILGGSSQSTPVKAPKPKQDNPREEPDELSTLNINSTLFPHGPVDPLNPSSFNDLLSAAETLLHRFQAAYRQQHALVSELRAEQSAQDDELDEAETRARHLKLQLDDMAAHAAQQDKEMYQLRCELDAERELRKREEQARLQSLHMVRGPDCAHIGNDDGTNDDDDGSRKQQQPPRRRHKRPSESSSIDSGFDSGDESCDSSVSALEPTPSLRSTDTLTLSLAAAEPQHAVAMPILRPAFQRRASTYDKMLGRGPTEPLSLSSPLSMPEEHGDKGVAPGSFLAPRDDTAGLGPWQVVSRMREENAHLRVRVRELESAVEDTLGMMVGIGLH
jgi:hypothetical protein